MKELQEFCLNIELLLLLAKHRLFKTTFEVDDAYLCPTKLLTVNSTNCQHKMSI
jgi:hypothetical protein